MMSRKISSLVILASLVCVTSALAQGMSGTISGTVTERGSERPLQGVQIRVVGTQRGAVTDASGKYRIVNVATGTAQLVAQQIGYGPQPRSVIVTPEGVTADFVLAMAATTLDQIVVTATGQSERRRESGASTAMIDARRSTRRRSAPSPTR